LTELVPFSLEADSERFSKMPTMMITMAVNISR